MGQTAARLRHPQVVRDRIAGRREERSRTAAREMKPWQLARPVALEVELATTGAAELAMLVPGITRVNGRVVSYIAPDMSTAYRVSVLLDQLTSR